MIYGFIYLTVNDINKKMYIGRRNGDPEKDKKYLGSGKHLKQALIKYGIENFSRYTLEICSSKNEILEAEKFWIRITDAVNSKEFYNRACGGIFGGCERGRIHSEETKAKRRGPRGPQKNPFEGKRSPRKNPERRNMIRLINPEGVIVEHFGRNEFCKIHKLNTKMVTRVLNGTMESHRGWKLPFDEYPVLTK